MVASSLCYSVRTTPKIPTLKTTILLCESGAASCIALFSSIFLPDLSLQNPHNAYVFNLHIAFSEWSSQDAIRLRSCTIANLNRTQSGNVVIERILGNSAIDSFWAQSRASDLNWGPELLFAFAVCPIRWWIPGFDIIHPLCQSSSIELSRKNLKYLHLTQKRQATILESVGFQQVWNRPSLRNLCATAITKLFFLMGGNPSPKPMWSKMHGQLGTVVAHIKARICDWSFSSCLFGMLDAVWHSSNLFLHVRPKVKCIHNFQIFVSPNCPSCAVILRFRPVMNFSAHSHLLE